MLRCPDLSGLRALRSVRIVFRSLSKINRGAHKVEHDDASLPAMSDGFFASGNGSKAVTFLYRAGIAGSLPCLDLGFKVDLLEDCADFQTGRQCSCIDDGASFGVYLPGVFFSL